MWGSCQALSKCLAVCVFGRLLIQEKSFMKRPVQFEKGCYYHIYNRGANRETIFREDANYLFLLKRLSEQVMKKKISVVAYCLMPNHYHFLLRQDSNAAISELIQAIFNSYSKAFNKKYNRSGTLFEGIPSVNPPFRCHLYIKVSFLSISFVSLSFF